MPELQKLINNFYKNDQKLEFKLGRAGGKESLQQHLQGLLEKMGCGEKVNIKFLTDKNYSSVVYQICLEHIDFIKVKEQFDKIFKRN